MNQYQNSEKDLAVPNAENNSDAISTYTGKGKLAVHVTTARGSIPVEGAQVFIRNYLPANQPTAGDVIFALVTNRDGNTEPVILPAPPRTDSLAPTNGKPPFATYNIEIYSEGYSAQNYINVPIFDGITAIQPADLIPLPENGRTDSRTPDDNRFFESGSPNL